MEHQLTVKIPKSTFPFYCKSKSVRKFGAKVPPEVQEPHFADQYLNVFSHKGEEKQTSAFLWLGLQAERGDGFMVTSGRLFFIIQKFTLLGPLKGREETF